MRPGRCLVPDKDSCHRLCATTSATWQVLSSSNRKMPDLVLSAMGRASVAQPPVSPPGCVSSMCTVSLETSGYAGKHLAAAVQHLETSGHICWRHSCRKHLATALHGSAHAAVVRPANIWPHLEPKPSGGKHLVTCVPPAPPGHVSPGLLEAGRICPDLIDLERSRQILLDLT